MNETLIISLGKFSKSYSDLVKQKFNYYSIYERNEDSTIKLFIAKRTDITMFYASCIALSVKNEYKAIKIPYTYSDEEISEIYREDIKENDISLFHNVDKNKLLFDIHNLFGCDQKKLFNQYFKTNNTLRVYYNDAVSEYIFLNDAFIGFAVFE